MTRHEIIGMWLVSLAVEMINLLANLYSANAAKRAAQKVHDIAMEQRASCSPPKRK